MIDSDSSAVRNSRSLYTLILFFFFLSGMTGLIYEIIWTRLITRIIGTAPFAVSIVLTVFMGGLGLGSYIAGKKIDSIKNPMRFVSIYGVLEIIIGLYCLVLPFLITSFTPVYAFFYNRLFDSFVVYTFLTFIGCALLLVIPVICMGATLPVLSRFYVTRLSRAGSSLGRLYGINTVGAALGALLCGFWIIRYFGIWGSIFFAVAINLVIGALCLYLGSRRDIVQEEIDVFEAIDVTISPLEIEVDIPREFGSAALLIFAVSGFCSMSYEVVWAKLLALIVGPTTYSFTIVLVTFITGLALGSIVFGIVADKTKKPFLLLVITQFAAAVFALMVSHVMGNSQIFFAKLIFDYRDSFAQVTILKSLSLFALMILPTFFLGATFPLVCKIFTRSLSGLGKSVGFAYAVNTVGSVLGSFCAGFLLVPVFGKELSLSLIVVLQLTVSIGVLSVIYWKHRVNNLEYYLIVTLAVLGLGLAYPYPKWNRELLSIGKYHRSFLETEDMQLSWFDALFYGSYMFGNYHTGELVYYNDGIGGFTTVKKSVDVIGDVNYSLYNSGKSDASTIGGDMCTQTLLAHFAMLFHPKPDNVMVLGLASGITAGEILNYPVGHLDVVDINKEVVEGSKFFKPWNGDVLSDSRTELIVQDGRAHLQLTDRKYDVIISEPSNPWMAGLAALFSADFFRLAEKNLNENGMFVQWIHAYQIDWENFSLIGRTFADVFPTGILVSTGNFSDYLLVGFKSGGITESAAERNLEYIRQSTNITMLDHRLFYRLIISEDLKSLFGDGPLHTDTLPILEYAAPRRMHYDDSSILTLFEENKILSQETEAIVASLKDDVDAQIDYLTYFLSFGGYYKYYNDVVDLDRATPEQRERFAVNLEAYCSRNYIKDFSLTDDEAINKRCVKAFIDGMSKRVESSAFKEALLYKIGRQSYDSGRYEEAIAFYSQALDLNPNLKLAHYNIGIVYVAQNNFEDAVSHFREEIRINPTYISSYNSLGNVMYSLKYRDQAIELYRQALEIDPDFAKAHNNLSVILRETGDTDEAERHKREAERISRQEENIFK